MYPADGRLSRDDGTLQRLLDIRQCDSRPAKHLSLGIPRSVLKDGRLGSVVEVVRFRDNGFRFDSDLAGLAEFYGMEISRLFVDHCLPSSGQVARYRIDWRHTVFVW
jgi:hypothetical protein